MGWLVSSYFVALYRLLRSRALGNMERRFFSAEYFTASFYSFFSMNDALRNACKMTVSVKLPLNLIYTASRRLEECVYTPRIFSLDCRCR